MKINPVNSDPQNIQHIQQPAKSNVSAAGSPVQEARNQSSGEDRVDLSVRSREMNKIYELLKSAPDVRTEKVEGLKEMVQSGKYEVRSEALADKMIRDSLLELNK